MRHDLLLADANPGFAAALALLLDRAGYRVTRVPDGATALAALRSGRPALAVLDTGLPGRSGFDLCEEVRADPQLSPMRIVLISARGRETDRARGMGAGADAWLVKPFATADLLACIEGLLA